MILHHLNCATMCPRGARFVNGEGGYFARGKMVCHVLVVETNDGLAIVDTGLGLDDLAHPMERLGRGFLVATGPAFDPNEPAVRQIVRLGYRVDDVRHVVVTHLDLDHAGGIPDFPKAKVHVHAREHAAAMARATLGEKNRYRPQHWAHGPQWALHDEAGEDWFGFRAVRDVIRGFPDLLLIPLFGHTRGHAGVAVRTSKRWLLHAGDAYFHHGELEDPPHCPGGLAFFQRAVAIDDRARKENRARLGALQRAHRHEVTVVSAHDPIELDRETARRAVDRPVEERA